MESTERIDTTLADDEGVCVDCGAIFSRSEKTYGLVLCEECTAEHIANNAQLCRSCGVVVHPEAAKRGDTLCSFCSDEAAAMMME
jgi:hypothetical protein